MSRGKKKKSNTAVELLVTVANFDTREPTIRPVYSNVPLEQTRHISGVDYMPAGGTPLNDAVLKFGAALFEEYKRQPGKLHVGLLNDESGSIAYANLTASVIEGTNAFLDGLKNDDSPVTEPGVIMVIMTDGEENSSVEDPTGEAVSKFIKAREVDGWNFFYLGANQDSWASGRNLGLGNNSSTYDFNATSGGTQMAYAGMSTAVNLRKYTPSHAHSQTLASIDTNVKVAGDEPAKLWTPNDTTDESEE